jgi:hypothetical protein
VWRFNVSILVVCISLNIDIAHSEVVLPEKDETISTFCECLTAFSGCESKLLSSAAGNPTRSWYKVNLRKGLKLI